MIKKVTSPVHVGKLGLCSSLGILVGLTKKKYKKKRERGEQKNTSKRQTEKEDNTAQWCSIEWRFENSEFDWAVFYNTLSPLEDLQ